MRETPRRAQPNHPVARAIIEVASIIFLFYSNLLMGQFDAAGEHGKTLSVGLHNIFTGKNFTIAVCSALAGYVVFEYLRRRS